MGISESSGFEAASTPKMALGWWLPLLLAVCVLDCNKVDEVLDSIPSGPSEKSAGVADTRAVTLVSKVNLPDGIGADETSVFYCDSTNLYSVPRAGGSPRNLTNSSSDIVVANDVLYLPVSDTIRAIKKQSGEETDLAQAEHTIMDMTLRGDYLYLVSDAYLNADATGSIERTSVLTGSVEKLVPGLIEPQAVAVDDSYLYFTDSALGQVSRAPLAGGAAEALVSGEIDPEAIAVDADNVYFIHGDVLKDSDPDEWSIRSVPKAGGQPTTLAGGKAQNPHGQKLRGIVIDSGYVYYVQEYSGIWRVPVHGGTPEKFALGTVEKFGVDGTSVYWTDRWSGGSDNETGRVRIATK